MSKTLRQERIGKKHNVSYTTVYNIEHTDSYLEYLESHAPSMVKWYKKTGNRKSAETALSEIEKMMIENMAENFSLRYVNRRLMADLVIYKMVSWFLIAYVAVSTILKLVDMFLA